MTHESCAVGVALLVGPLATSAQAGTQGVNGPLVHAGLAR